MFFPWNNNFINPGMFPINPNQNNFNQMNMNMINNPMGCGMFPFNPSLIPETGNIKNNNKDIENLIVRVMMEGGKILRVYCNSNDKLEIPINQFLSKAFNSEQKKKDDFFFFIMEERKVNMNLSVGDNGIKEKNCYIFAKKKNLEEKMELQSLKNSNNDNNEFNNNNNNSNDDPVFKPMIKGEKRNLDFKVTTGLVVRVLVGAENSVKEALIMFCNKVDKSPLLAKKKKIIFLYNAASLEFEDNRKLGQIFLSPISNITVLDSSNIIGA